MQQFLMPVKWIGYLLLDCHSFKLPEGTDSGACVLQRRQLPLRPLRCFFTISSSSFKIRKLAYPLTQYVYVWLFIGTQKWIYKMLRAALSENSNWGPGLPGVCMVKNLPSVQETQVPSLDAKDPLEKGTATHSSNLAWRIPWTEEPGGLQSMDAQRLSD